MQRFLPRGGVVLGRGVHRGVRAALLEEFVGGVVRQRERGHLDDVALDADRAVLRQVPGDHLALHGEQANFRLHREVVDDLAAGDLLVVPDDLVQGERDLLLGLELHDVGNLRFLDGRQLHEPCQAAGLPGDADGDDVVLDRVAREELFERLAGQRLGVGVRLGHDLRVFDVVERGGRGLAVHEFELEGLQGALAHVETPNGCRFRHVVATPQSVARGR